MNTTTYACILRALAIFVVFRGYLVMFLAVLAEFCCPFFVECVFDVLFVRHSTVAMEVDINLFRFPGVNVWSFIFQLKDQRNAKQLILYNMYYHSHVYIQNYD